MICPICNSRLNIKAQLKSFYIHTCDNCKSGILIPRPNQNDLMALHTTDEYYEHEYFEQRREISKEIASTFEQKIKLITQDPKSLQGKKILDVGCDTGLFIKYLKTKYQVDVEGVDISLRAVEDGRKDGLTIHHGQIQDVQRSDHFFDIITAFDLIEHVDNPTDLLKAANKLLKPNGKLILETPNYNGLVYLIGRLLSVSLITQKLFSPLLERLWPKFHVQYFTKSSLRDLILKCNYKIEKLYGREIFESELTIKNSVLKLLILSIFKLSTLVNMNTLLILSAISNEEKNV